MVSGSSWEHLESSLAASRDTILAHSAAVPVYRNAAPALRIVVLAYNRQFPRFKHSSAFLEASGGFLSKLKLKAIDSTSWIRCDTSNMMLLAFLCPRNAAVSAKLDNLYSCTTSSI